MTRLTAFLCLFLLASGLAAQNSFRILDSLTREPVPFTNVWVVDKEIGATSDESGTVILGGYSEDDVLLCSAVGYYIKKQPANTTDTVILLKARQSLLQEIDIAGELSDEPLVLGDFKKSEIRRYGYGCGQIPWIVVRYFDGSEYAYQPALLSELMVGTTSDIKNATMALRVYAKDSAGFPGELINKEPIYLMVKKGFSRTTLNLDQYHLELPEEGFFIGFEWLLIESNKHYYDVSDPETGKLLKDKYLTYQPSVSMQQSSDTTRTFSFDRGSWKRPHKLVHSNYGWKIGMPAIAVYLRRKS